MVTVNLKELYPWITEDENENIEITEEMYEAIYRSHRQEENYRRRTNRHKAFYSLDNAGWMESFAVEKVPMPEDILIRKEDTEALYAEIEKLTETQRRRLCACYIEGVRKTDIARREGVSDSAVTRSIRGALAKLAKRMKKKI